MNRIGPKQPRRKGSSQTTPRKALEFCARTLASGLNGGAGWHRQGRWRTTGAEEE